MGIVKGKNVFNRCMMQSYSIFFLFAQKIVLWIAISALGQLVASENGMKSNFDQQEALFHTPPRFIAIPGTVDSLPSWLIEASIVPHMSLLPSGYIQFDHKAILHKLEAILCVEQVKIRETEENALIVNYTLREPIAFIAHKDLSLTLSDTTYSLENRDNLLGCDIQGHIFPMSPFYSPKNLPYIIFPITSSVYRSLHHDETAIRDREIQQYLHILQKIQNVVASIDSFQTAVNLIDFSKMCDEFCFFQREIVFQVECTRLSEHKVVKRKFLIRLHPENANETLIHIPKLMTYSMASMVGNEERDIVLDLRYTGFCLFSHSEEN